MSSASHASSSGSSWRRLRDRSSLRVLEALLPIDEDTALDEIDSALTKLDSWCAARRQQVPHEQAMGEARKAFAQDVSRIMNAAMEARDLKVAQAAMRLGKEGLLNLQTLGALLPIPFDFTLLPQTAMTKFVGALDYTREFRAHDVGERLAREVSIRRGRISSGKPPRELALPNAHDHLLTASDVQRLAIGLPVVIDPSPSWATDSEWRVCYNELRSHLHSKGLASTSSCNTNAITSDLPLLGADFGLSKSTERLLRLLTAVPAVIDTIGWERPLRMPPLLQLASYSAEKEAHYRPHYDRNDWERYNRREITILLYLNVGWDAATQGGELRVHTETEGLVDLPPVAGRLVLFHSALTKHEVLPCLSGERVAVTLWVEYG